MTKTRKKAEKLFVFSNFCAFVIKKSSHKMQRFQTYDSKQAKSNNDSLISHGRFARFEFGVSVIVIYLLFVICILLFLC